MYPLVEIEGSLTPCTFLPTGERRAVALTDTIAKFIDKGYVVVVAPEHVFPEDYVELVDAEPTQQPPPGAQAVRGYQQRIAKADHGWVGVGGRYDHAVCVVAEGSAQSGPLHQACSRVR